MARQTVIASVLAAAIITPAIAASGAYAPVSNDQRDTMQGISATIGGQFPASGNAQRQQDASKLRGMFGESVSPDMTGQSPAFGDLSHPGTLSFEADRTFELSLNKDDLNNTRTTVDANVFIASLQPVTIRLCDNLAYGGSCSRSGSGAAQWDNWTAPINPTLSNTLVEGDPLHSKWTVKGDCNTSAATCDLTLVQHYTQGGTPNRPSTSSNPSALGVNRAMESPGSLAMASIRTSDQYAELTGDNGLVPPSGEPQSGSLNDPSFNAGDCNNRRANAVLAGSPVPIECGNAGGKTIAFSNLAQLADENKLPEQEDNPLQRDSTMGDVMVAANLVDQVASYADVDEDTHEISVFAGNAGECKQASGKFMQLVDISKYASPMGFFLGTMIKTDALECCSANPDDVDISSNLGFCNNFSGQVKPVDGRDLVGAMDVASARLSERSVYIPAAPGGAPDVRTNKSVCGGVNIAPGAGGPIAGIQPAFVGPNAGGVGNSSSSMAAWYAKYFERAKECTDKEPKYWLKTISKPGVIDGSDINGVFAFGAGIPSTAVAKEVPVGKVQTYCVFPTMLARIIQEQGRQQIESIASHKAEGAQSQDVSFPFYGSDEPEGGWSPVTNIAGNTVAFWMWPDACGAASDSEDDQLAAATFRGETIRRGSQLCPMSSATWVATCPDDDVDNCGALPAYPMKGADTDWWVSQINTADPVPLVAVDRYVAVQGECRDGDAMCEFRVDALPKGIGGRLHATIPIDWSPRTYIKAENSFLEVSSTTVKNSYCEQPQGGSAYCWHGTKGNTKPGNYSAGWPFVSGGLDGKVCQAIGTHGDFRSPVYEFSCHETITTVNKIPQYDGGWDPRTKVGHNKVFLEAFTWPKEAEVSEIRPRLRVCVDNGGFNCSDELSSDWTEIPPEKLYNSVDKGCAEYEELPFGSTKLPECLVPCPDDSCQKTYRLNEEVVIQQSPKLVLKGGGCNAQGCSYTADLELSVDRMPWSHPNTYRTTKYKIGKKIPFGGSIKSDSIKYDFQSYPNCEGFTLDQFLALDLSAIDLTEYVKSLTGKARDEFTKSWPGSDITDPSTP